MDTNTQSTAPSNPVPPPYQPQVQPEQKKIGPIIAILVIVVVLIIAGIYLLASRVSRPVPENSETATTQEVQQITSNSDEVTDLEADLNASVSGLDGQNF